MVKDFACMPASSSFELEHSPLNLSLSLTFDLVPSDSSSISIRVILSIFYINKMHHKQIYISVLAMHAVFFYSVKDLACDMPALSSFEV
jgi:hypothetical protein